MGKIEAEASIKHFSHPHLLNLVSIQPSTPNKITCSACKKEALGLVYICESCNYCLHKTCSSMPESLSHQADQNHSLTLLPAPAYSGRAFQCNACGVLGTGFCYHCEECQLDLHPVCAFMRSTIKNDAHDHPLKICFEPPYENKAFICGASGSNHWLYRCELCGLDVHLKCAKASNVQPEPVPEIQQKRQLQTDQKPQSSSRILKSAQPQIFENSSVHHPATFRQPQVISIAPQSSRQLHRYYSASVFATTSFGQQPGRNDTRQNVVNSLIEGLIEGAANQLGQAILQGALGN